MSRGEKTEPSIPEMDRESASGPINPMRDGQS